MTSWGERPLAGSDLEQALAKALVASRLFGAPADVRIGRLRLVRYLGQGAAGVVYEALDPERGPVAVKLLGRADAAGVYRVKREFRSLASVQHPNLVLLHELVHERGHWFFSMELVHGEPFDLWVRSPAEALDEHKLRCGLLQLASAVSAIHAVGKLHRDLKPSNVLVTREGVVKVLDFGLVADRAEGSGFDTGLAGTPEYMAPEQAAGLRAGPESDWYAVGVMLYRVLAGRLPFEGHPLRILDAKRTRAAPKIELPGGGCAELAALCERLLLRDPVARAGADDVLATLEQRSAGLPTGGITHGSRPQPPPFIGREAELDSLRSGLRAAAAGRSTVLLVDGPSGIGKSALLDRFAAELGDDVLLLRGRCYEQESLPYKVFDAVVDALSRHLRTQPAELAQRFAPRHVSALIRLFPVLGRVEALAALGPRLRPDEPGGLRDQAFEAAKELLLRLTDSCKVVIMVDDLQWGDLDSARMMSHVFGLPEPPPLLFVGASRGEEARHSPFVSAWLDECGNSGPGSPQRLSLAPLPAEVATRLASELLGGEPTTEARRTALAVANEAAGVPFFITELVEYVRARGDRSEPYQRPASLEQAVLDRVAALPEPCRELLDVLVVASEPIEVKLALAAAALPNGERSFVHALRSRRLVRGHGSTSEAIEIYHDRIRHTLAARLDRERVRSLHARIASAMTEHGVRDPDRLVAHYIGAGDHARAAEAAWAAALAAAGKLAFNRAAELYGRTLELLSDADPQRAVVRQHWADALAMAGRGARASEQYLLLAERAERAEPAAARELRLKAAQQCLRSGLTSRGIELAQPLLERHDVSLTGNRATLTARYLLERARSRWTPRARVTGEPDADTTERLAVLGGLFQELMISDPLRGAILHATFLRHALRQSDPVPRLRALVWECFKVAAAGGVRNERRGAAILREIGALRQQVATPYAEAMGHLAAVALHQHSGRFAAALTHAQAAQRLFEQCPGTYWERAHCALLELGCYEFVGELRDITRMAPEWVRAAAEREDNGTLLQVLFSFALARLANDEAETMLAFLDKRIETLGSAYGLVHFLADYRVADCLLYLRRNEDAWRHLDRRWRQIERMPYYRGAYIRAIAHSLRAKICISAFAHGRDPGLLPMIRRDIGLMVKLQHGYGGLALIFKGTLLHLLGEHATAVASLEAGIAEQESNGFRCYLHSARRRLGEVLGDERGADMLALADAGLAQQGIRRPARFTAAMMGDIGAEDANPPEPAA